ncbi:DNA-deoxyinosine glycosylase [Marinobacterium nitratireducens]|uniref:DNA-deoxyinosine glycosylase n=1 Tax=Marinobacterium nitratireducens TaxID=518897 RepID=A0A918DUH8_9GAMM|nr:DNA-deoxyinosine glycosylase [Marinobacterium nitratireducens]GGO82800.1 DNA-deoxyinosine glycosylase [Marinobacterium nitratireducens]
MADIQSFDYVAAPDARVLILGSIPGVKSLQEVQYYAHPRNGFWPIMAALLGFPPSLSYPERLERLKMAGIALWDVVHRCHRPGSLDQNIAGESVEANDFSAFFRRHPRVHAIYFNGGTAETMFKRHVVRAGIPLPEHLSMTRLPSTSPANAGTPLAQKLEQWRVVMGSLRDSGCALQAQRTLQPKR